MEKQVDGSQLGNCRKHEFEKQIDVFTAFGRNK